MGTDRVGRSGWEQRPYSIVGARSDWQQHGSQSPTWVINLKVGVFECIDLARGPGRHIEHCPMLPETCNGRFCKKRRYDNLKTHPSCVINTTPTKLVAVPANKSMNLVLRNIHTSCMQSWSEPWSSRVNDVSAAINWSTIPVRHKEGP